MWAAISVSIPSTLAFFPNQGFLIAVRKFGAIDAVTPNLMRQLGLINILKTKLPEKFRLVREGKNFCYAIGISLY